MTQATHRLSTSKAKSTIPLHPPQVPDPRRQARLMKKRALFYGHEGIATMSSRFIRHLFACPDYSLVPRVKLSHFIASTLHRANLHPSVLYTSLVFLQRLKARFPSIQAASGHRLFMTALVLASKFMCDDSYTNKSWELVADGVFTLENINQMEKEMCGYLGWQLAVHGLALLDFEKFITSHFSKERATYPTYVPPATTSKQTSDPSMTTDATTPLIPDTDTYITIAPALNSGKGDRPTSLIRYSMVSPQQDRRSPESRVVASTSATPPPPYSMNAKGDTNSANFGFTHVEEAPPGHPLQDQMFAFAVPSNF